MSGYFLEEKNKGVLSDKDIKEAIQKGEIYIAPFEEEQLQPAGYNLTPTRFFYSTKKKRLLSVVENDDEVFVMIDKNDTVLVRTRESVAVSSSLSGAFYSKVKVVSEGFGHVSTTLDPRWEGQLLISLNNPTNRKLKFSIEKKVYGKTIYNSFVTVEFMGLDSVSVNYADNPPGRLDILDNTVEKNISTFKKKEVNSLWKLLQSLHECEDLKIDDLVLRRLNSEEMETRNNIYTIENNEEFEMELHNFFQSKRKKYLRFLQEDFYYNAKKSIDIINEYVSKKQKYLPLRTKVWCFFIKHMYRIIGLTIAMTLILCLLIDPQNSSAFYTAFYGCVLYIVFPIIQDIFLKSK